MPRPLSPGTSLRNPRRRSAATAPARRTAGRVPSTAPRPAVSRGASKRLGATQLAFLTQYRTTCQPRQPMFRLGADAPARPQCYGASKVDSTRILWDET